MRWAALLIAAVAATPVAAQTRADFAVSARIVNGCAISVNAGGVLGRIDFGSAPGITNGLVEADMLSASGTGIAIECTPGATATLTADLGQHSTGGERQLASAADRIGYRLLIGDGATVWGNQPIALSFSTGVGPQRLSLRGRALLTGAHRAGRYTDTVRVTVSW